MSLMMILCAACLAWLACGAVTALHAKGKGVPGRSRPALHTPRMSKMLRWRPISTTGKKLMGTTLLGPLPLLAKGRIVDRWLKRKTLTSPRTVYTEGKIQAPDRLTPAGPMERLLDQNAPARSTCDHASVSGLGDIHDIPREDEPEPMAFESVLNTRQPEIVQRL